MQNKQQSESIIKTPRRSAWLAIAATATIATAATLGYFAAATANANNAANNLSAPPQPVVAIISLTKVLESLDEAVAAARDLETIDQGLKSRVDTMVRELEALGEDIRMLPPGSPERLQAEQRFRELRIRIEVEQNIRKLRIEEEYASNLNRIFDSIRQATTAISRRNGYTLVFYDDSTAETPPGRAGVDAIRGAINQRRVAFVDNRHDITQEVIDFMNNQFARRPKAN